ncbi:SET domain-containing protein [Rhizophagus irregularis]|uniref:SET domain-containing protein n=4 Tax=Rhizophagus irregularis TaxID=588596 RepID=A0A2N1MEI6_9GLOM|nr:SET domain-containing protein [Rhizophagus irregularis]GBC38553.2 histone-lysine N-methyltransferase ASH1L [Rhizophagus irregularis DAOM 181602=DAOM 197198]PKC73506.1 SET domain-containing protein [Rhizophagus irregularis]PKK59979.1 SET domain-containing protein [Rhizophagus irregularis]UZO14775.1 hypothetical protein OCT59_006220 [Rhizophagus irregularis]
MGKVKVLRTQYNTRSARRTIPTPESSSQPDTPEDASQIIQQTVSSDSTIPTPESSAQVNLTRETIQAVSNVINTTISTAISERICGNPNCQTREPSAWRRDLAGTGWLCNACGLFIRARGFHRPKDVCLASAAKLQAMYSNSQSIKLQKSVKQRRSQNNCDGPDNDYGTQPSTTAQTTELSLVDEDVMMSEASTPEPMNDASSIKNEKRPWEKKIYLNCGLYSVDLKYKDIPKRRNKGKQKERPTEIFPLPIQYGTFLMTEERNFRLPWDVMIAHKQGILKRRPAPYKKIPCNIFIERRRKHEKPVVCQCILPSDGGTGCTEECYNRVMFYECSPKDCPCKDKCSNQRFQKKERVKELEVIETPNKGFGLRTKVPIKKGQLIIEYRGEVISHETAMQRMETLYKNRRHSYFLDYEKGEVLDGGSRGTEARFINHSCAPNCHIEKWRAPQGELFVGVFASKNIVARTELTYDYNFSKFGGAEEQLCYCGTPTCRGLMGSKRGQKESIKSIKKKVKGAPAITACTPLSPKEQLVETSAQEESIAGLLSDGSLSSVDSSLAATPTESSPSISSSTASNPLLLAVDMLEVDMLDDLMEL